MAVGTSMQRISSLAILVRQLRSGGGGIFTPPFRLAYHPKPVLNRVKKKLTSLFSLLTLLGNKDLNFFFFFDAITFILRHVENCLNACSLLNDA